MQGFSNVNIWLVDDHHGVLDTTQRMLEAAGYGVRAFDDPTVAAQALEAGPAPDVLVTDVVMPQMRGTELAQRVGQLALSTPVILMSGYAEELDEASQHPACFQALLQKPFSGDQLLELIRQVAGRADVA